MSFLLINHRSPSVSLNEIIIYLVFSINDFVALNKSVFQYEEAKVKESVRHMMKQLAFQKKCLDTSLNANYMAGDATNPYFLNLNRNKDQKQLQWH
jgi:hypothetical protein